MKKTTFVAGIVLLALVAASFPGDAKAAWFGEKLTASIFSAVSTFFQKVQSVVSQTINKVFSFNKPSEVSCVPPVSAKPSTEQNALGTMTITPEVSEETKDSTIVVSLASHTDSLTVQLGTDPQSPYRWSTFAKANVIDWGPKPAELPTGEKGVTVTVVPDYIQWETHDYVGDNNRIQKRAKLPAQTYWIKLKVGQTSPWESNKNIGSYGWKEVRYLIHYVEGAGLRTEDFKTVSGKSMYYVGGPQYPTGAIARVGNNIDPDLTDTLTPNYGKTVTVKAGEPLEVEARPTGWQGGTFTINPGSTANIIGPKSITVKAGESAVFKLLPRNGTVPVKGKIEIANKCNEVFATQFPPRSINPDSSTFEAPIEFDFKGVAKETMELAFRAGSFALDFKKPQSSITVIPLLSLMDDGVVVAPAPGITLAMQAVYKDNPKEVVKNVNITPIQATTDKEGAVRIKVSAPNITKEELSRGILLKVSTPDIAGLASEIDLLFTNVVIEVTKPQTTPAPTPQPQPTPSPEPSIQLPVQNVIVSANKAIGELTEKDKVTFTAKLMLSDGSLQTTKNVKWAVLGQIGSITAEGVFTAKLDDSIAEAGEALGFVTATYEDSAGNAFLGQTTLIKVKAFILDQPEAQG